jgi:dienelactone hydrolase
MPNKVPNSDSKGCDGPPLQQDCASARISTRRWVAQRWLVDNIIRTVGIDWDQPRSINYNAPCGPEANADFAAIRERVRKFADIAPAFAAVARRREAKACAADEAGEVVTARQNYFMAAVHWGAAQWPYDETNDVNLRYNQRKRECYARYAALADHRVEAAWIPFQGKALPGWLHLPPGHDGGRIPAVVSLPGMDSFKEVNVSMYGDRWLTRGIAVLALEGPGQYESAVAGIHVSVPNWIEAAHAIMDWIAARPEIDPQRIGIAGSSFGSFFSTIVSAHEPRFRACAVSATCLEPGCRTIFEEASPTFKQRFMWMAGYTDEDAFDEFCKSLTWEGHAERIRAPYLCVAGEADELSPPEHTERLMIALKCPKQLVVYQDCRHSVGNVASTNLGPHPAGLVADWMAARLAGKSFPSERWLVEASGNIVRTPY